MLLVLGLFATLLGPERHELVLVDRLERAVNPRSLGELDGADQPDHGARPQAPDRRHQRLARAPRSPERGVGAGTLPARGRLGAHQAAGPPPGVRDAPRRPPARRVLGAGRRRVGGGGAAAGRDAARRTRRRPTRRRPRTGEGPAAADEAAPAPKHAVPPPLPGSHRKKRPRRRRTRPRRRRTTGRRPCRPCRPGSGGSEGLRRAAAMAERTHLQLQPLRGALRHARLRGGQPRHGHPARSGGRLLARPHLPEGPRAARAPRRSGPAPDPRPPRGRGLGADLLGRGPRRGGRPAPRDPRRATAATPSASTSATPPSTATARPSARSSSRRRSAPKNRFDPNSQDSAPRLFACLQVYGDVSAIPVPDIDRTDYLLVLGANPAASMGSMMALGDARARLRGVRERGGRIVLFDPRRTETAAIADAHHFIRPGGDAALLLALLHVLFAEGLVDEARVDRVAAGLPALREVAARFPPERVAAATGVPAGDGARRRPGARGRAAGRRLRAGRDLPERLRPGGELAHRGPQRGHGQLRSRGGRHVRRARGGRGPPRAPLPPGLVRALPVARARPARAARGAALGGDGGGDGDGGPGPDPRVRLASRATPSSRRPTASGSGARSRGSSSSSRSTPTSTRRAGSRTSILPPAHVFEVGNYELVLLGLAVHNVAKYSPPILERAAGARDDWEILSELSARVLGLPAPAARALAQAAKDLPDHVVDLLLRAGPAPPLARGPPGRPPRRGPRPPAPLRRAARAHAGRPRPARARGLRARRRRGSSAGSTRAAPRRRQSWVCVLVGPPAHCAATTRGCTTSPRSRRGPRARRS